MVSAKDLIEKIKDCDGSGFKMEEISIRKVGANFRMLAQNLHAESRKNLIYFIEHIIRKSNTLSWKKPIRKDIEYSVFDKNERRWVLCASLFTDGEWFIGAYAPIILG